MKRESVACLLITQGDHKFYTFTLNSDVLASCSFVLSRYENPKQGFQRYLNKARATEIAEYLDSGLGTIPSSIVVSAQEDAKLEYNSSKKTVSFNVSKFSFLILDGQHRVYGFSLAKNKMRVPVVVYEGLTPEQEVSIFIDLNTKQKPVPNELLLDIKKLAKSENTQEKFVNSLFDLFNEKSNSRLKGLMSPSKKEPGKISRVTFKSAMSSTYPKVQHLELDRVYIVLNSYLGAAIEYFEIIGLPMAITNPTILGALIRLFPEVFQKVRDKNPSDFSKEQFEIVLRPILENISNSRYKSPGGNKKDFYTELLESLRNSIQIEF